MPVNDTDLPPWPSTPAFCEMCGWSPAQHVSFYSVTGIIFWWKWQTVSGFYCQHCGGAVFHECQARTMALGWWGLLAPIASLIAIGRNAITVKSLHRMAAPSVKQADQVLPGPVPPALVRPAWRRPLSILGTSVAVAIVILLGVYLYNTRPAARSDAGEVVASGTEAVTDLRVGDCIRDELQDGTFSSVVVVPCSDLHDAEVYAVFAIALTNFSESGVAQEADEGCFERLDDYLGSAPWSASLEISSFVPTSSSWSAGDRTVTCMLGDSAPTTGSKRGTAI